MMRMLQRRFAVHGACFPNCCIVVPIALPYLLVNRVTENKKTQNRTQYRIQGIGIIEGLLFSGQTFFKYYVIFGTFLTIVIYTIFFIAEITLLVIQI